MADSILVPVVTYKHKGHIGRMPNQRAQVFGFVKFATVSDHLLEATRGFPLPTCRRKK